MSTKRPASSRDHSISPPPTRRRLTINPDSGFTSPTVLPANHLSIYSWNVNGVGPLLQKQISFDKKISTFPLRTFLKRHNWPHLLCLQEVKIRSDDRATQRMVEFAANSGNEASEPTYSAHFSLPRDKYNATGFGGKVHGVATVMREDLAKEISAIRRPDWDLEGRVLVFEMRQMVAIVNGYWVNGTNKPYRNPDTGITTGTRHHQKLRFHQHMLEESLALQNRGFQVVLIGDMNIACSQIDGHPNLRTSPEQHVKNRFDFNQKFLESEDGFCGIDVFRHFHGQTRKYTYRPRGVAWGSSCDRVDNILVSRSLISTTGAAHISILTSDIYDNAEDRGHSDHVPLYVTVDLGRRNEIKKFIGTAQSSKIVSAPDSQNTGEIRNDETE